MKQRVEDHPSLVRDSVTKAIIVDDKNSYESYVIQRQFRNQLETNNKQVENDINILRTEISEIKQLLKQIVGDK